MPAHRRCAARPRIASSGACRTACTWRRARTVRCGCCCGRGPMEAGLPCAQRTRLFRDEMAGNLERFVRSVPIAALIPCLLLVTALVIARSLRPMVRLAEDLDARPADDMAPLPLAGMPSELHPFIASINGLLERMKRMMDQQRRFIADAAHEATDADSRHPSLQAENLDPVDLPENASRRRLAALKRGVHAPHQAPARTIAGTGAA